MRLAHDISLQVTWGGWQEELPGLDKIVCETAVAVLNKEWQYANAAELSIVLADDEFVRVLNASYRDQDKTTNVLSFPATDRPGVPDIPPGAEAPVLLGDVVLAFETCLTESKEISSASPLQDHTRHLLIHGILHLLGHDHENEADAEKMETLETNILAGFGVTDPYQ